MEKSEIKIQLDLIWKSRYQSTSEAFEWSKTCLDNAEKAGDSILIAYALLYKNLLSFWLLNDVNILTPIFKSIVIFKEHNDELGLSRAYNILGSIYDSYGNYNLAIEYAQLAINAAKEGNKKEEEGDASTTLGQVYSRIHDYNAATVILKTGLQLRQETEDLYAVSSSLNLLARTYTLNKEYENALLYYNKSLTLRKSLGDKNGLPWTFLGFASMYQQMEEYTKASDYYQLALANKNDNKRLELLCFIGLGKIELINNHLEKALAYLTEALASATELKMKSLIFDVHFSLSELYKKQQNTVKELEHFKLFYHLKDEVINTETTNKLKNQQIASSIERSEREAEIYQLKNIELKKAYDIVNQKNIEITDSNNYAKRIQDALFPTLANFYQSFPASYLIYKPKDIVAGDFYWMEKVGDKIYFAVADCTGHGVPGALVSVICNNALNRSIREFKINSPAKILDKVTRIVRNTFDKSTEIVLDGMDIALCSFNTVTKELVYSGANNSLYIITQNAANFSNYIDDKTIEQGQLKLVTIPADKQPIGNFDYLKPFTNHTVQLEKGDFICLFSDGFADQFGGEKGEKFKYIPFKNLLLSAYQQPYLNQKELVETAFNDWKGELDQIDDVCVMGINIQ